MVFEVQGKTEKYVKLLKDGDGVKFLGKYSMDSIIRLGRLRLLECQMKTFLITKKYTVNNYSRL